jgi:hypothetical protein
MNFSEVIWIININYELIFSEKYLGSELHCPDKV